MKTILAQPQYKRFTKRGQLKKLFVSTLRQQFSSAERKILIPAIQKALVRKNFHQFNEEGD